MKINKPKMFFLAMALIVMPFLTPKKVYASYSYKTEGIESFPESYKPYLLELQKQYPNWTFTALYTELDWKYVIDNENKFGVSLVPKSYSDAWKNRKAGQYNVEVDARMGGCFKGGCGILHGPKELPI